MNSPQYKVSHTVALLYFKNNVDWCGIVLDGMYGSLFPLTAKKSFIILNELSAVAKNKQYNECHFHNIDDNALKNKRFLTNMIWPCNITHESDASYYLMPRGALTQYELHEPENIYSIFPKEYDMEDYKVDLVSLLLNNRPLCTYYSK